MSQLVSFLDNHASAIQAIAAIVTAGLTLSLIIATVRYVRIANESLKLSREQFAEMMRVDVLIRMEDVARTMTDREAKIELANLSNRGIWWEKLIITVTTSKNQVTSKPVEMQVAKVVPAYGVESVLGLKTLYQAFVQTGVLEDKPFVRVKIVSVCRGAGKEFSATYESPEVVLGANSFYFA